MKALVTGGGGFLGGAIVRQLMERGDSVRSFSRGTYPELEALGVEARQGDLTDANAVAEAVAGCEIAFHVAAKPGVWGPYAEYHDTNVVGTENVINACRSHRVRRLVFTSTPSVVFEGKDQEAVDESAVYPKRYLAHYPKTKALAERLVRQANGEALATVSLRPHLIWGPGDTQLVPRVIAQGKAGTLRIVGKRQNKVDSVYIDNAAEAHLLAADRLAPGSPVAGKVYFITNDEPVPMAELINMILQAAGVAPVTRVVPGWVAYAAGALMEGAYSALGVDGEPRMTRFVARQLSTAHWFNISAAKRDFGYRPKVTIEQGMERLAAALH